MRSGFTSLLGLAGVLFALGQAGPGKTPPTYHQDIRPMLERSCTPCHRAGGMAPFALDSYAAAFKRASLIRYQTIIKAMPPCVVRSDFGDFCETPAVTDAEIVTIQNWVRAGAPEGVRPSNPAPNARPPRWRLGPPDQVLRPSGAIEVPAEGSPYWRAYRLELKLPANARLRAFDLRPASPNVLRSALLAIAPAKLPAGAGKGFSTAATMNLPAQNLIGAWAPGYRAWSLPNGSVRTLQKGDRLLIQLHYRQTGKKEDGGFELGLYFQKSGAGADVRSVRLGKESFVIPANKNVTLASEFRLASPQRLVSILPEARFFASWIAVEAILPDGSEKMLFETLRWDPYWAGNYVFAAPPILPAGTVVRAKVTYNNDERCPANEGRKPKDVPSGPTLADEIFRVTLQLAGP
jgi:hypothetical protein